MCTTWAMESDPAVVPVGSTLAFYHPRATQGPSRSSVRRAIRAQKYTCWDRARAITMYRYALASSCDYRYIVV